ncbi:6-phosphogluconate dehydrogenase C-terminal domain-like protein [Zalerion maritima]|uniref:6-phosphogluconate dehydrogenase C-terminal domain-like protein n=1 Tax=Zalerion maritima TaxID=339359 RepID=A0AAD5RT07_9PEZI|nr:6-phosphogluconate dehydrogenase C-terminal domain-like protein [Zalerion maritima]
MAPSFSYRPAPLNTIRPGLPNSRHFPERPIDTEITPAFSTMTVDKANVLLIGCGGIGTIGALNLEVGGKAAVTAVLRSNYEMAQEKGFHIRSCDHGLVEGFRPSSILKSVPDVEKECLKPFNYIVCTTKNIPDVPPALAELIRPAVTPGHSVIVLAQNGLNIEKPLISAFPDNIVLSGVSFCGSHEVESGEILHEDYDEIFIGPFHNPNVEWSAQEAAAKHFVDIYGAGGKTKAHFTADVGFSRWRKLLYNACLNPICALTDLDTGRIQLCEAGANSLVRPAMEEIRSAAAACGFDLPAELVDFMLTLDPIQMYNPPSMQVDLRKGRFCEFENIVGEPLREGLKHGVPMPTLTVIYNMLRCVQWRMKEKKGLVEIPPHKDFTNTK